MSAEGNDFGSPAAWAVVESAYEVWSAEGDDAAAPLFEEAVAMTADLAEPGPRVLLIDALVRLAEIRRRQGRDDESRSIGERILADHFDDAPPDAAECVVDAALQLAWLRDAAGDTQGALDLQHRVLEHYGRPGVPRHRRTAAQAECQAAWTLRQAQRPEAALAKFESVIRATGDPADSDLEAELARALVGKAYALFDLGRDPERIAACRRVVDGFADSEDPEVEKQVARAREMLDPSWRTAESWHALGRRLHSAPGRAAAAERAYRAAIEEGSTDSSLHLGVLLSGVRGRVDAEEHAFRTALDSTDPEISSWAGLKLGNVLQWLRGDLDGARACFELAAERGSGTTAHHALINLAFLDAHRGDRRKARETLLAALVAIGDERGCDMRDSGRAAGMIVAIASARATRNLFRRYRRARYELGRLLRALVTSSRPAAYLSAIASARDAS